MAQNQAGHDYPFEPEGWVDLFFHLGSMLWKWLIRYFVTGLVMGILIFGAIQMMTISPKMALAAAVPIAGTLFFAQMFSHRKMWKFQFQLKLYHVATTPVGMIGFVALCLTMAFHWYLAGIIGGLCLGYMGGLISGLFAGYLNEEHQETTSY